MILADQIRKYVLNSIIEPARRAGNETVTVRAGDVHSAMGLKNRLPAVCAALGATKFVSYAQVRIVKQSGPINGSNTKWVFELGKPPSDRRQTPPTPYQKTAPINLSARVEQPATEGPTGLSIGASGIDFQRLFAGFFRQVAEKRVEVYNEFSLQHELGIWLRANLPKVWKVQFERNVSFFGLASSTLVKREIDITLFDEQKRVKHAFELKYPRNGQHPEQMFSFCKDIAFLEQLCQKGFSENYFITVADDPLFYQGDGTSGIYQYFRGGVPIQGVITKPTGARDECVTLAYQYLIQWFPVHETMKCAIVRVQRSQV